MRGKTAWVLAGLVAFALGLGACDSGSEPLMPRPPTTSAVGGAPSSSSAGGAGGGDSSSASAGGATPSFPVRLGLRPNPSAAAVAPGDDPVLLADLQVLAAGARTVVLEIPFDAVDAQALASDVERYAERDLSVVVQLLVVDRRVSRSPFPQAEWDDPAVQMALADAVATIAAAGAKPDTMNGDVLVPEVDAVVLGRDVGVYLDDNPDQSTSLKSLLTSGVAALEGEGIASGIGLSYRQPATDDDLELASKGTRLTMSYFPALSAEASTEPVTPGQALDAMIELAGGRPIILTAVGMSSATDAGSDETQQQQRLGGFFTGLEPRREAISMVVIHQLHDLDTAGCAELATSRGEEVDGEWSAVVCETGLRGHDGLPKAAWTPFLQAAANLSSP